ncbi:sensor histidine kinase [Oryzobacter telluris]|uniref:sensor histidine kinase n=1 Tax=Oryzobacter telluris TaxID=3149179 RepID=UPI00370D778E
MTPRLGERLSGLSSRLLLAQALLLLAGAVTTWVVASFVGPSIFHGHLMEAGAGHDPAELLHVERAFRDSLLIAMGVALLVSVLTAWSVTAWFTRRVRRSTSAVVRTAGDISAGQYAARIRATGLGSEFDRMGVTINELAGRLEETEATRRRLLSDLGHELRTPLSTVQMQLDAVDDGVRPFDGATMEVLRANTNRLRRLADDIAAVSRAQEQRMELRREPTDLVELARRSVAEQLPNYAMKGVQVTARGEEPVEMGLDPARMGQVLSNLLSNALRHTPEGGSVIVEVRCTGTGAAVDVVDDGEGIAPEQLPLVFERFFRVDPARGPHDGGAGIGLTISRSIVEAHGGRLSAFSGGPGTGTRFTVDLPG